MTLEVLIYLIHKAPLNEEGENKIAFMSVYCTRFTYVDNCLKNIYYSCIQKHTDIGNVLLFHFIVGGFFLCNIYPFLYRCENKSVADKTEVLQSSLSRLNSGDNVIILVNVIYFS